MKSMKDILKEMEKQHGPEGLYTGNSDMTTYTDVITTGSYALDDAIGIWGLPKGRLIQFAGQESSGKTYMSLVTIAEYQKLNPQNWALFIDAEFTFDPNWAQALGVDLDRLMVYRENIGSKIFERLTGKPSKSGGKKAKLGILDLEKENPTGLGIIVLDSVAYISPPQEVTSEAGKQNMALLARFLPPELRKVTPLLSDTGVTFIAINQIRLDPGIMWGSPESTPGGKALKHALTMMLNFSRIAAKDSNILDENGDRIGHHVKVRIDKNKVAIPYRVATIALTYTGGIVDKGVEVRDIGARYGVIQRPNNKTWVLNDKKYNGKEAMALALEEDPALMAEVLEKAKLAKSTKIMPVKVKQDEESEE